MSSSMKQSGAEAKARKTEAGSNRLMRQLRYLSLCLVLLLLVAGCGQSQDTNSTATPSVPAVGVANGTVAPDLTASPATAPTAATAETPTSATEQATPTEQSSVAEPSPSAPVAAGADTYQNPVLTNDFADPDVIKAG